MFSPTRCRTSYLQSQGRNLPSFCTRRLRDNKEKCKACSATWATGTGQAHHQLGPLRKVETEWRSWQTNIVAVALRLSWLTVTSPAQAYRAYLTADDEVRHRWFADHCTRSLRVASQKKVFSTVSAERRPCSKGQKATNCRLRRSFVFSTSTVDGPTLSPGKQLRCRRPRTTRVAGAGDAWPPTPSKPHKRPRDMYTFHAPIGSFSFPFFTKEYEEEKAMIERRIWDKEMKKRRRGKGGGRKKGKEDFFQIYLGTTRG